VPGIARQRGAIPRRGELGLSQFDTELPQSVAEVGVVRGTLSLYVHFRHLGQALVQYVGAGYVAPRLISPPELLQDHSTQVDRLRPVGIGRESTFEVLQSCRGVSVGELDLSPLKK
jgi:hypothetical protein